MWYGVPTITSRFLGYLMNLSLPLFFAQPATTADLTQIYAIIPFLNVLFTYGLETAYFRFNKEADPNQLYSTLSIALLGSTILFTGLLWFFSGQLTEWANLQTHPEYIQWMIGILFFDTLSTLAFAKLRQDNRPKKYAAVRLSSVLLNLVTVLVFIGWIPYQVQQDPNSWLTLFTKNDIPISNFRVGPTFL